MGGGAGIRIEADSELVEISISKKDNKWEYNIPDVDLYSFKMEGYDDGLSDIRGNMLKSQIALSLDEDTIDDLIESYKKELSEDKDLDSDDTIEFIDIDVSYDITLNDMYWAGYLRGKAEDITSFDCDIEFKTVYFNYKINGMDEYIEINYDDCGNFENQLEASFIKSNEEEFNAMYNSIFELPETPSDDEIKEYREVNEYGYDVSDDSIIESMTEQDYDFIRSEYTV